MDSIHLCHGVRTDMSLKRLNMVAVEVFLVTSAQICEGLTLTKEELPFSMQH